MRINKFKVNNIDTVQVYLSNNEYADNTIQIELAKLKKQYKNVGIFVSGKDDFKNTAEKIINNFQNFVDLG